MKLKIREEVIASALERRLQRRGRDPCVWWCDQSGGGGGFGFFGGQKNRLVVVRHNCVMVDEGGSTEEASSEKELVSVVLTLFLYFCFVLFAPSCCNVEWWRYFEGNYVEVYVWDYGSL